MWRILNILFGFQYIVIPYAFGSCIRRVKRGHGGYYVVIYGDYFVLDTEKLRAYKMGECRARSFLFLTEFNNER